MAENTIDTTQRAGKGNFFTALILAGLVGACVYCSGREFLEQFKVEPIYKGPGVTQVKKLSDYNPWLKGSNGDSAVYVLDSGKPGGTFIIMGGTHPTEPSGLLSAVLFVENAVVAEGRVLVVPHSNNSAYSTNEPGLGHLPYFHLKTRTGKERYFRFGNRGSNPVDQFPDPDMYLHYPSGQNLAADEIRNLNRGHPGNPRGLLTQQIAYAFSRMCLEERADIIMDHHEAPPEKPLVNAVCVHQKGIDLASEMALLLEDQGIPMRVEISPIPLHGFSHREIGDFTPTIAILSETPNPSQGSARGASTEALIVTGFDPVYEQILARKLLKVDYKAGGVHLNERTGRNVATNLVLAELYTANYPDVKNEYKPGQLTEEQARAQEAMTTSDKARSIVITNMPSYADILKQGVGYYLRDADATEEEIAAVKNRNASPLL